MATDTSTTSVRSHGGGAFGRRPRGRAGYAIAAAIALVIAGGLALALRPGSGRSLPAVDMRYGGYPSWLTDTALPPVNTVLRSTAAHPKLEAIEGNTIDAIGPSGSAYITAAGPSFPAWVSAATQAGTLNSGDGVPATFAVTVIGRAGTMPIGPRSFSILTSEGQLVHPAVTRDGGGFAPADVRSGQDVTLLLRAKLVEGEGSVRWAPDGVRVLAGWLYQLELD